MLMRHMVVVISLAMLAGLIPAPLSSRAAQPAPAQAGVVVRFGDGTTRTACVALGADGTATGEQVLRNSGLQVTIAFDPGAGSAVCKIDQEGCDYPREGCFCQCTLAPGQPCRYWSYYHLGANGWVFANQGASSYTVRAGAVEGWSWGPGGVGQGVEPPDIPFEEVCSVAAPVPATPTATATATLTATSLATVTPTPTDEPASPTPVSAVAPPTPMIMPVASSTPPARPPTSPARTATPTRTSTPLPTDPPVPTATAIAPTVPPTAISVVQVLPPSIAPTLALPTAEPTRLPTTSPTALPDPSTVPTIAPAGAALPTATPAALRLPLVAVADVDAQVASQPPEVPLPTGAPALPSVSEAQPEAAPAEVEQRGSFWFLVFSFALAGGIVLARIQRRRGDA